MWGNILTDYSFNSNFNIQFPNTKSDILIHLSQWQYWWWFWFSFFWVLYYLFLAKVLRNRTLKFRPKIVSSFRPHGKWGDLIICLLPVSWCFNILVNSNFLLKLLEWQAESSLFTIRIRGKQWYWVYKFDFKNFTDIISTPKNIGSNKWIFSFFGDLKTADNYLHILQMRSQNKWIKGYWLSNLNKFSDEKKNNLNYLDNSLPNIPNSPKNKKNFFFSNKASTNFETVLLPKMLLKQEILNKLIIFKEKNNSKLSQKFIASDILHSDTSLKKNLLAKSNLIKKKLNCLSSNMLDHSNKKYFTKLLEKNRDNLDKTLYSELLKKNFDEKNYLSNFVKTKPNTKINCLNKFLYKNKIITKKNLLDNNFLKKNFFIKANLVNKKLNMVCVKTIYFNKSYFNKLLEKEKFNLNKKPLVGFLKKYLDERKYLIDYVKRKHNIKKNFLKKILCKYKFLAKKNLFNNNFLKKNFLTKSSLVNKKLNMVSGKTIHFNNNYFDKLLEKKIDNLNKTLFSEFLKKDFDEKNYLFNNFTKFKAIIKKNFLNKFLYKDKIVTKRNLFNNNFLKKNFLVRADLVSKKLSMVVSDEIIYFNKNCFNEPLNNNINKTLFSEFLKKDFDEKKYSVSFIKPKVSIEKNFLNKSLYKNIALAKENLLNNNFLKKISLTKSNSISKKLNMTFDKTIYFDKNYFNSLLKKNFNKKDYLTSYSKTRVIVRRSFLNKFLYKNKIIIKDNLLNSSFLKKNFLMKSHLINKKLNTVLIKITRFDKNYFNNLLEKNFNEKNYLNNHSENRFINSLNKFLYKNKILIKNNSLNDTFLKKNFLVRVDLISKKLNMVVSDEITYLNKNCFTEPLNNNNNNLNKTLFSEFLKKDFDEKKYSVNFIKPKISIEKKFLNKFLYKNIALAKENLFNNNFLKKISLTKSNSISKKLNMTFDKTIYLDKNYFNNLLKKNFNKKNYLTSYSKTRVIVGRSFLNKFLYKNKIIIKDNLLNSSFLKKNFLMKSHLINKKLNTVFIKIIHLDKNYFNNLLEKNFNEKNYLNNHSENRFINSLNKSLYKNKILIKNNPLDDIFLKKNFLIKSHLINKKLNTVVIKITHLDKNYFNNLLEKNFNEKNYLNNHSENRFINSLNKFLYKNKILIKNNSLDDIFLKKNFLIKSHLINKKLNTVFIKITHPDKNYFNNLLEKNFNEKNYLNNHPGNRFINSLNKLLYTNKILIKNNSLDDIFLKKNFLIKSHLINKKLNMIANKTMYCNENSFSNFLNENFDDKNYSTNHTKAKNNTRKNCLNKLLHKKEFLIKEILTKKSLIKENIIKKILIKEFLTKKKISNNTFLEKNNTFLEKNPFIKSHPVNKRLNLVINKTTHFYKIYFNDFSEKKNSNKKLFTEFLKKNPDKKNFISDFSKTKNTLEKNLITEIPYKKLNLTNKDLIDKLLDVKSLSRILKKNLKNLDKKNFILKSLLKKNFLINKVVLEKNDILFYNKYFFNKKFLKYTELNENYKFLFLKKKNLKEKMLLNNFLKKNFNFNFLKKRKQFFKNSLDDINYFKLHNTQFNFKRFTNSEEPNRVLKNSMGGDLSITLVKKNFKNEKNFNNKNYLFKLRFDNNTSYKNTPKASYFTFKQKRYKRRTLIQPFTKDYKNILKKDLKLKGNFNLNKNYVMEDNIKNPTKYYRMLRKNKTRSENMPLSISKRLLRVKRTLVIPTHINITAITNSYDVVHSWFIPGLGLKMDCVPGRSTHHTFYVDNAGFYYGQCAEICGRYHHHMPIRVCALPFEHFLIWWNSFGLKKFMFNSKDYKNIKIYSFRKFVW